MIKRFRSSAAFKIAALVGAFGLVAPFGSTDAGAHGDNSDPDYLHLCVYTPTGQIGFRLPNSVPACNYANRTLVHVPTSAAEGPAGAQGSTTLSGGGPATLDGVDHYFRFGDVIRHSLYSDSDSAMPLPVGGTVSRLVVVTEMQPGAGEEFNFAVVKNGVTTGASCSISDLEDSCEAVPNVDVATGDTLSVTLYSYSDLSNATTDVTFAVEIN